MPKHHSLYGQMLEWRNWLATWERVRANRGKGGVDGQSIEAFAEELSTNLGTVREECKAKS